MTDDPVDEGRRPFKIESSVLSYQEHDRSNKSRKEYYKTSYFKSFKQLKMVKRVLAFQKEVINEKVFPQLKAPQIIKAKMSLNNLSDKSPRKTSNMRPSRGSCQVKSPIRFSFNPYKTEVTEG